MKINQLNQRPDTSQDKKLTIQLDNMSNLIEELDKRDLSDEVASFINDSIKEINVFDGENKDLRKLIVKSKTHIITLLEKELKLVPKNHNRNKWMILGMAAFGIPLGSAIGASLGNMSFLGIGLPIGMGVGIALGAGMDQKAFKEGRQLDFEVIA